MKIRNLLFAAILFQFGCNSSYIQVVSIKSNDTQPNATNQLTFENDTVKIVYNFFNKNGGMQCAIFNKTNEPMSLLFRESGIVEGTKFNSYMNNRVPIVGEATGGHDFYYTTINAVAVLNDDMAFLPPQVATTLSRFDFRNNHYSFTDLAKGKIENILTPNVLQKKIIGKKFTFNQQTTPSVLRHYLTFSMGLGGKKFSVQHDFWIESVDEVKGENVFYSFALGYFWETYNFQNPEKNRPMPLKKSQFILPLPAERTEVTKYPFKK